MSGESCAAVASRNQHLHHARVDHRAAARNLADGGEQLSEVGHAFLEQVGAAGRAVLQQRQRVLGLGELAEHHHADVGPLVAQPSAARSPSSVPVGGMRMSVMTTSGRCSSTARSSSGRSLHEATSSMSSEAASSCTQALTEQVVVLGEDDSNRHRSRIGEPVALSRGRPHHRRGAGTIGARPCEAVILGGRCRSAF